jgi:hypothetical protein
MKWFLFFFSISGEDALANTFEAKKKKKKFGGL